MIIDLKESQCINLCDFIEFNIFDYIRNDTDIDNIDWLVDMMEIYQKLKKWNTASRTIEPPIAYNIDKVIEQLEAFFNVWGLDEGKKEIMREIVRDGAEW